jgi:SAM-dependent methyltransferase
MYGQQLATIWDLFYREGRGKDYAAEAEQVARTVLSRRPEATSLLDVGCGTGEHLVALTKLFDRVEGLDQSEHMVAVAQAKVPAARIHVGDMCSLDLGRTFDAVISLNTAVAYLPSLAALGTAVDRMARHLAPGGVLVVEPWWFPERYLDGYVAGDVVRGQGRTVARVSRTRRRDGAAHMDIHYVVAGGDGIEHFTETHVFGLWTREQYLDAFARAGCAAEYVEDTLAGYGMFVAQRGE